MNKNKHILSLLAAGGLLAGSLHAQIELTVDNDDWNDAAWGSPVEQPTAGNDYVVDGSNSADNTRVNDGGGSVFAGDSLTLTNGGAAWFAGDGTADWILDGGEFRNIDAGSTFTIGGTVDVQSDSTVDLNKGAFNWDAALSGSGTLSFSGLFASNAASANTFGANSDGGFTGIFSLGGSTNPATEVVFTFETDFASAGLDVTGDAVNNIVYDLTGDRSFGSVTFGSTVLSAGTTYDATALANAGVDTDLFNDGGGTLTVIPEPSSFALLAGALGLGLVCLRRRRVN